jgi:probable HAF family extracellular repeat protein
VLLFGTRHQAAAEQLDINLNAGSYTFVTLDVPGAASGTTETFGINDRGQIVGTYGDFNGFHGFLYDDAGFTTIDVPGGDYTIADGVNNGGQIVGIAGSAGGFSELNGSFTIVNVPGSVLSYVSGTNNLGQMVGTYFDAGGTAHGFVYTEGAFTTINVPIYNPNAVGSLNGINNDGEIVGTYYDAEGAPHGFLYDQGTFYTIPVGTTANVYGINDRGQISGSYTDAKGAHGFVYDHGITYTIDYPGVPPPFCPDCPTSTAVFGINNRGQVVGVYSDSTGTHSFIATPVRSRGR